MDRHPFFLRMRLGSIQLWIPSQVKAQHVLWTGPQSFRLSDSSSA